MFADALDPADELDLLVGVCFAEFVAVVGAVHRYVMVSLWRICKLSDVVGKECGRKGFLVLIGYCFHKSTP